MTAPVYIYKSNHTSSLFTLRSSFKVQTLMKKGNHTSSLITLASELKRPYFTYSA